MGDLRNARVSRVLPHRSDHEPLRTSDLGVDRAGFAAVSHVVLLTFLDMRLEDGGLRRWGGSARYGLSALQQRGRHVLYLWRLIPGLSAEAESSLSSYRGGGAGSRGRAVSAADAGCGLVRGYGSRRDYLGAQRVLCA